jgi:hypothetical protein
MSGATENGLANSLKPRWWRWKIAQNAHLLICKLRFFAIFRLASIGLIEFA